MCLQNVTSEGYKLKTFMLAPLAASFYIPILKMAPQWLVEYTLRNYRALKYFGRPLVWLRAWSAPLWFLIGPIVAP